MRWADHVERVRGKENACMILADISLGKSMLGGPRRRWKDIDVDDEEMRWEVFDWINLVQDTSCCEHVNEVVGFIKCGEEMIASDVGLCSLESVIQVTEIRDTCF
jgi:hypothetical protein